MFQITLAELLKQPAGITFSFKAESEEPIEVKCILVRKIEYFDLIRDESPVFEVKFNANCLSTFKTMIKFLCTNTKTKKTVEIFKQMVSIILTRLYLQDDFCGKPKSSIGVDAV